MEIDREFLKGSISLLLLNLLSRGELYGYEILQEAARRSAHAFEFKEGTLYPALHQLRSEEHTSELQSRRDLVCRLLLEKKKKRIPNTTTEKQKNHVVTYRTTNDKELSGTLVRLIVTRRIQHEHDQ